MTSTLTDEDITTTTLGAATASLADPDGTDGGADGTETGTETGTDPAPAGDTVTDGDGSGDAD